MLCAHQKSKPDPTKPNSTSGSRHARHISRVIHSAQQKTKPEKKKNAHILLLFLLLPWILRAPDAHRSTRHLLPTKCTTCLNSPGGSIPDGVLVNNPNHNNNNNNNNKSCRFIITGTERAPPCQSKRSPYCWETKIRAKSGNKTSPRQEASQSRH